MPSYLEIEERDLSYFETLQSCSKLVISTCFVIGTAPFTISVNFR